MMVGNNTITGILWRFGERFLAQLVSTVVSIVLARILTTDAFGLVAMVNVFIVFANIFVTEGLGRALVQAKEANDIEFSSIFWLNLSISIFLYGVLFICAPIISNFYGYPELVNVLRVFGVSIIIASINSVQQAYIARKMQFKKFFFATLGGTIVSGVVGIILAYKGFGVWALVAQHLTNMVIDTIILQLTIDWRIHRIFSLLHVKPLWKYSYKITIAALLATTYQQIRSLIIGKQHTASDLAFYTKGNTFPSLIMTNVNVAVSTVLASTMAQKQNDRDSVKQSVRQSVNMTSLIIFPAMMGLGVLGTAFITVLLGEKWLDAVPFMQISCFVYATWVYQIPTQSAIKAIGRSDLYLKIEIFRTIVNVFVCFVIMKMSPISIALSQVFLNIISMLIICFCMRKEFVYTVKEQIQDLLYNLLPAFIMACMVFAFIHIFQNVYIQLFGGFVVGTSGFLLACILTRNKNLRFIVSYIKKSRHNCI